MSELERSDGEPHCGVGYGAEASALRSRIQSEAEASCTVEQNTVQNRRRRTINII